MNTKIETKNLIRIMINKISTSINPSADAVLIVINDSKSAGILSKSEADLFAEKAVDMVRTQNNRLNQQVILSRSVKLRI